MVWCWLHWKRQDLLLAKGARWLVGEKERGRREKLGRTSSTVVAFVRGVTEADVLLKKEL